MLTFEGAPFQGTTSIAEKLEVRRPLLHRAAPT